MDIKDLEDFFFSDGFVKNTGT